MKLFKKILCVVFVLTVLFAVFAVSASAYSAYIQSDSAYNLPYVADSYSTQRFVTRTVYFPTRPDLWFNCPTVFYTFNAGSYDLVFDVGNDLIRGIMEIRATDSGGTIAVLNNTYTYTYASSAYVPALLFIVYNGHITCYSRDDAFTNFLFDIKYDPSTVPKIASGSSQYSAEVAYLLDSSLHTDLVELGTESYSGAFTAGQLAGSPVTIPVDNILDKVTQAVITPFTSAIQPIVQSNLFNTLISILAFVLLFGILVFIIKKVRGG